MKNLALVILLTLSAISCAHRDTSAAQQQTDAKEIAFEGHCANSVCHDDMKTLGKKEFSMEHAGKTYYFSSAKARDAFKVDMLNNINSAQKNWDVRSGRTQ